jgi:hypothetical protein
MQLIPTSSAGIKQQLAPQSPQSQSPLIGLRVVLADRDPCRRCGGGQVVLGSSASIHAAGMTCACCGAFRGWLGKEAATFITQRDAPTGPIIIRSGARHDR